MDENRQLVRFFNQHYAMCTIGMKYSNCTDDGHFQEREITMFNFVWLKKSSHNFFSTEILYVL